MGPMRGSLRFEAPRTLARLGRAVRAVFSDAVPGPGSACGSRDHGRELIGVELAMRVFTFPPEENLQIGRVPG
jgi:hypothetical protein